MTTIVKHRRTGNEYILLGINGEIDKVNPSRFISELFNQEKSEVACSATVCDVQGNLFLAYIDDLTVIGIDGKKPADILPENTFESADNDLYPRQSNDFSADERLEEESFDDDSADSVSQPVNESETSSTQSQSSTQENDSEEKDDDDWI